MAEITKLKSVLSALRRKYSAAEKDLGVSCVVGYTAAYAVFVHEDLQAAHGSEFNIKHADKIAKGWKFYHSRGENQQAKFLETPARQLRKQFQEIIAEGLKRKQTLAQVLLQCGLLLQRESQKICPVNTGNLRASAFTRLEKK